MLACIAAACLFWSRECARGEKEEAFLPFACLPRATQANQMREPLTKWASCSAYKPPPEIFVFIAYQRGVEKGKSKSGPYFPSVTCKSTKADKPEVNGALILTPSLQQCSVLLKATREGKKSKQRFEVTPDNRTEKHRRPRSNPLYQSLLLV